MEGKVSRIQHDAGQQALSFHPVGLVIPLAHILQKLRDQLTGRGGVGLVADKGRVLNKAHALAVVVDDGHLAAFFENFFALYQIDLVCIHHDAQRPLGDDGQCTFGVDEIVLLPGGNESIDQAGRQRGIPADRDNGRHITNFADAEHALGRTDGVQVTHPVAHDDHMVRLLDELDQLVGHNAAAHLAALFHAMADAAVERKAVRRHLGGLVAAAALGHIQCLHRHVLGLPQGLGPAANADGEGQVHTGVKGADLIQHIVAPLGKLLQLALLHHRDVAAAGHPAQKARAPADHLFQHPVDALQQAGALAVQHVAEHIVVAIHQKDEVTRAAGFILRLHPAQGGLLIEDHQRHRFRIAGHGGAVGRPHAIGQGQLLALLGAGLL